VAELTAREASGVHRPLELRGQVIDVDTSQPIDERELAERVAAQL
jgi:hypothetical protein